MAIDKRVPALPIYFQLGADDNYLITRGGVRGELVGANVSTAINVKSYGAEGDGATNDSTAIQAAITAAFSAGGGTVFFPAGNYICEGLVLYDGVFVVGVGYTEDGSLGTRLRHPATPAADMFTFVATTATEGGGISNLRADGIDETFDFLSFENVSVDIEGFYVRNNYLTRFRRAIDAETPNTRNLRLGNNYFYDNTVGIYIGGEHPLFESMNEFRLCTTAIMNVATIHIHINNQKFAYCTDAIKSDTGGSIREVTITGCIIFYCNNGITIDTDCFISGNLFGADANTNYFVKIVGGANGRLVSISNNYFDERSASLACGDGCIVLDNASGVVRSVLIDGNQARLYGDFIGLTGTSNLIAINIVNNSVWFGGTSTSVFVDTGAGNFLYSNISNNVLEDELGNYDSTSTAWITIDNNGGFGNKIEGNIFECAVPGDDEFLAMDVDVRATILTNNFFRRGGLYINDSDAKSIVDNNLFYDNVYDSAGAVDTIGYAMIDGSGGAYTLTLANGSTDGDIVYVTCFKSGNDVTFTVANHQSGAPTNFTFNAIGDSLELAWDAGNGYWTTTRSDGV